MWAVFKHKKTFFMEKFVEYLKDTKAELKHVSWPTKDQSVAFTLLVIGISVFSAVLLGLFDSVFKKALEFLLLK